MPAWSVCAFIDSSTISVVLAIKSLDSLSVMAGIIIDGSFGGACCNNFSCFIEIDSEFRREDWRCLGNG